MLDFSFVAPRIQPGIIRQLLDATAPRETRVPYLLGLLPMPIRRLHTMRGMRLKRLYWNKGRPEVDGVQARLDENRSFDGVAHMLCFRCVYLRYTKYNYP